MQDRGEGRADVEDAHLDDLPEPVERIGEPRGGIEPPADHHDRPGVTQRGELLARCGLVGDDHHGRRIDVFEECGAGFDQRTGIEDHPGGLADFAVDPGGEARIVGAEGPGTDRDRIHLGPPAVDQLPALGAADPFRVAGAGSDFAVEAHRHLQGDQGTAGHGTFKEVLDQQPGSPDRVGVGVADTDAGLPQDLRALAVGLLGRVGAADDDFADLRFDERVGAGRLAACVGAGLEGDVDGGTGDIVSASRGVGQGLTFSVEITAPAVPSFTDDFAVPHDHAADRRVGAGEAPAELRQLNGSVPELTL